MTPGPGFFFPREGQEVGYPRNTMRLLTSESAGSPALRTVTAAIVALLVLAGRPIHSATQDGEIIQTDVTTPTGSQGVMVRPYGPGPFPAVLHLHGSGETVAKSLVLLRVFARAGYVAMDIEYRQNGGSAVDIDDVYASLEFLKHSRFVRPRLVGL